MRTLVSRHFEGDEVGGRRRRLGLCGEIPGIISVVRAWFIVVAHGLVESKSTRRLDERDFTVYSRDEVGAWEALRSRRNRPRQQTTTRRGDNLVGRAWHFHWV